MSSLGRRIATAGLLVALGLIVGASEAEAGITVIKTTVMQVGDPLAELDLQLSLDPNTLLAPGDNITLLKVADFNFLPPPGLINLSANLVVDGINVSALFSATATPVGSTGLTDIELKLDSINTITYNNSSMGVVIGDLYVLTTEPYLPPPNSPIFDTITYTTLTHTVSDPSGPPISGGGTTTPFLVVPEPASVILVGVGPASTLLLARCRRQSISRA